MKFSKAERQFLAEECIEESWLFDASGLQSLAECKRRMRDVDAAIAVNLRYCGEGHRITNGRGICLQCFPGALIFIRRWMEAGFVYLAESKRLGLIKVGTCKNLDARELSLNEHTYAGGSDWVMKTWVESSRAGQFEHSLSIALIEWREVIEYDRYRKQTYGTEAFRCTYRRAKAAFDRLGNYPDLFFAE